MRYLVRARLREGSEQPLLDAIGDGSLGKGSVAGDEYFRDMETARLCADGTARWVETCFCSTPLQEERPYWEKYFELVKIQDSHDRRACRDWNGEEPWACVDCDCTKKLEQRLAKTGEAFLSAVREAVRAAVSDKLRGE